MSGSRWQPAEQPRARGARTAPTPGASGTGLHPASLLLRLANSASFKAISAAGTSGETDTEVTSRHSNAARSATTPGAPMFSMMTNNARGSLARSRYATAQSDRQETRGVLCSCVECGGQILDDPMSEPCHLFGGTAAARAGNSCTAWSGVAVPGHATVLSRYCARAPWLV